MRATTQPRHRLDLRSADVVHGLLACVFARRRVRLGAQVRRRAEVVDDGLVAASVRSAWDLLLGVETWPPGSEVVVSAVTHPQMAALCVEHGLVPVPVDLDLDTLLPTPEALAAAGSPRTRAVLVAQLFGGRGALGPVAELCRERGWLLVEDAAQAWCGPAALRSEADVTFVSFGLIKTATALGGALVRVADPALLSRLHEAHGRWPVQRRSAYAVRVVRAAGLLVLSRPGVYGTFRACVERSGHDVDVLLDRLTRTTSDARTRRQRPATPLLALLARRLRPTDPSVARVRARAVAGERLRAALPDGLFSPGAQCARTHWLFGVRSADPPALVRSLRAVGVDASASTSNLVALTTEGAAADLMRRVVYVPTYPELPTAVREAVRHALHTSADRPPQRWSIGGNFTGQ